MKYIGAKPRTDVQEAIETLKKLIEKLSHLKSYEEKASLIETSIEGIEDFGHEHAYLLKALCAIGQKSVLESYITTKDKLDHLLQSLGHIERFYTDFGGIVGYQTQVLKLLSDRQEGEVEYRAPQAIDTSEASKEVREYILEAIAKLDQTAQMYAIGGAADRLNLIDEASGMALPAAKLQILSHNLLEHMVRDLFAFEYLHFKLHGKQIKTPIAMMTSQDKENDRHIKEICESQHWFGRDKERFLFFCQPLVPTFNRQGKWVKAKDRLLLKPGGHGVIWKLAHQEKIFEQLGLLGCRKALVRQINNPIAATDFGLLAFMGVGLQEDKKFGFASCPRRQNAKEGVNVSKKTARGWALSNIEYCDLRLDSSECRHYPANTNLLFVDLKSIQEVVTNHPYPGVLLNFKPSATSQKEIARLELTMQNIADHFDERDAYLTLNPRHKTISAAKKAFVEGQPLLETPEGCFLDIQRNCAEVFKRCNMKLCSVDDMQSALFDRLPYLITYHPALGPLFSIIEQKIEGGSLGFGSEMRLEISDLYMRDVEIDGSFQIEADGVMGHIEEDRVVFSGRTSRVVLERVKIENKGINYEANPNFVKGEISYHQRCLISLGENSEFIAKDVALKGDFIVRVPANTRCIARTSKRKVEFTFEKIDQAQSLYRYEIDEGTADIRALKTIL